jgi:metallo-beta-lactamase class B
MRLWILILLFGVNNVCAAQAKKTFYKSETLTIEKLTEHTLLHISYLNTNDFGKVACNGMIVIDNGEALIFDTPADDNTSKELIDWVENNLNCKVRGVIVTHFHTDCLGGLAEFHNRQIPSYATNKTIALAKSHNWTLPQYGFDVELVTQVGRKKVLNKYFGEGHTQDNIVSFFATEKVLFGGCLIKAIDAGNGNLEDANVNDWSTTVKKIKNEFPKAKVIIPGHGKTGGQELLDYTIKLFEK